MEQTYKPTLLNLGCGFNKIDNFVNVDAFDNCEPDVKHDLNSFPYPWGDNSVDGIEMWHVLEHIPNWWEAFEECARILKPGGYLHIRVPDESSATALCYRDHHHVFNKVSFHGIIGAGHGTNAWARTEQDSIPLIMQEYYQVPHKQYEWMTRFPRLLRFCADHLRNFIWEQRFIFIKVGKNGSV
jgi:ubiquinone/menaquinone biosynthesis C-methylase UbiE